MNLESLNITRNAYPYLVAQRGALDDMKGDPLTWIAKYIDVVFSEFRKIEPYLPKRCDSILDVGSGLGGIDALLNEHYGGDCQVTLLDGVADPPEVTQHNRTFNDMAVAAEFLVMNGVQRFDFIDANDPKACAIRKYDLIVSFKSWCFHIEPERYLDLVLSACVPQHTQLIVDLRGGRVGREEERSYHWERTLRSAFTYRTMIHYGIKFETLLLEAK